MTAFYVALLGGALLIGIAGDAGPTLATMLAVTCVIGGVAGTVLEARQVWMVCRSCSYGWATTYGNLPVADEASALDPKRRVW